MLTPGLRWSVCLAALSLLVYRSTDPAVRGGAAGSVLADRKIFAENPLAPRLARAREVWVLAPAGKNFLSPEHCTLLRSVLADPGASVRCVVLNPSATEAVRIAAEQLTGEHSIEPLPAALDTALSRLRLMRSWDLPGELSCRVMDYSPGFSLVAIDPEEDGTVVVELHGVANDSSSARMHLTLTPGESGHWYRYWVKQFAEIWARSTEVT
ncbi:hypothetical protein [Actinocorallia longicatena]|uniref:hypothetical protein n=1 Tax=Actinocorallia longicatena TaxID=111803 RepID=UPI0031DED59C